MIFRRMEVERQVWVLMVAIILQMKKFPPLI